MPVGKRFTIMSGAVNEYRHNNIITVMTLLNYANSTIHIPFTVTVNELESSNGISHM